MALMMYVNGSTLHDSITRRSSELGKRLKDDSKHTTSCALCIYSHNQINETTKKGKRYLPSSFIFSSICMIDCRSTDSVIFDTSLSCFVFKSDYALSGDSCSDLLYPFL